MVDTLEIVGFHQTRKIEPAIQDMHGNVVELALGDIDSRLYLRGPSGKVYMAQVPRELVEELQTL